MNTYTCPRLVPQPDRNPADAPELHSGWNGRSFEIIVSVMEPDRDVDSTNEARREELRQMLWW